MPSERSFGLVAPIWCGKNSHKVMDVDLAVPMAELLDSEVNTLLDDIEMAWVIIANAGGGDWSKESADWQKAAAKWRDEVTPKMWANKMTRHENHAPNCDGSCFDPTPMNPEAK